MRQCGNAGGRNADSRTAAPTAWMGAVDGLFPAGAAPAYLTLSHLHAVPRNITSTPHCAHSSFLAPPPPASVARRRSDSARLALRCAAARLAS